VGTGALKNGRMPFRRYPMASSSKNQWFSWVVSRISEQP
jgi:hypothetical protein